MIEFDARESSVNGSIPTTMVNHGGERPGAYSDGFPLAVLNSNALIWSNGRLATGRNRQDEALARSVQRGAPAVSLTHVIYRQEGGVLACGLSQAVIRYPSVNETGKIICFKFSENGASEELFRSEQTGFLPVTDIAVIASHIHIIARHSGSRSWYLHTFSTKDRRSTSVNLSTMNGEGGGITEAAGFLPGRVSGDDVVLLFKQFDGRLMVVSLPLLDIAEPSSSLGTIIVQHELKSTPILWSIVRDVGDGRRYIFVKTTKSGWLFSEFGNFIRAAELETLFSKGNELELSGTILMQNGKIKLPFLSNDSQKYTEIDVRSKETQTRSEVGECTGTGIAPSFASLASLGLTEYLVHSKLCYDRVVDGGHLRDDE